MEAMGFVGDGCERFWIGGDLEHFVGGGDYGEFQRRAAEFFAVLGGREIGLIFPFAQIGDDDFVHAQM